MTKAAQRRELDAELASSGQRVADLFETGELVAYAADDAAPQAQEAATAALARFLAAADRRRLLPS